ncbi:c-type cytochrome [Marinobacter sp. M216]|uniref:C-type cytochrome n=1 Tax=Marinobacter albus TaxID=3030833 RepID=A0ABT7HE97_9GAMM|nr:MULTISPECIES: c-type cytochrome [unclassified Marinobacter]MBW7469854.1 c-type cytochrome [Marinobacter sp. F4218]MDK9557886.1 c-type cytochrome [Marinobacter sp. M216]
MNNKAIALTLTTCLSMGASVAFADSHGMMKMAEEKKCLGCHLTSEEVPRAPSFQSVAQKYTEDDREMLVEVVKTGGEDHWGSAVMPPPGPRPEVSDQEANDLVDWILGLRDEGM